MKNGLVDDEEDHDLDRRDQQKGGQSETKRSRTLHHFFSRHSGQLCDNDGNNREVVVQASGAGEHANFRSLGSPVSVHYADTHSDNLLAWAEQEICPAFYLSIVVHTCFVSYYSTTSSRAPNLSSHLSGYRSGRIVFS